MVVCLCQMENEIDFPTWLQKELDARGWNQSDLSRRSGITTGQISRILNGTRGPAPETLNGIAKAFHLSPELIFRIAGLLPPRENVEPLDEELLDLFEQLTPEDQDEILQLARMKIERRKTPNAKTTPRVGRNNPEPNTR